MFIAWTTVATRPDADRLAVGAIQSNLAACVQVEGPIVSYYRWQGQLERTEEFRLTFKCLATRLPDLEKYVLASHPYETAQWTVVRAERVSEKYLSWAEANSSNPPL